MSNWNTKVSPVRYSAGKLARSVNITCSRYHCDAVGIRTTGEYSGLNRLLPSVALRVSVAFIGYVILMLSGENTAAQQLERRDTVAERYRPGLDADGVPLGGMRLYPDLGVELRSNDNVRANNQAKLSDTAMRILPEIRLESRTSRHRAEIGANGDITRYSDLETEDYEDYRFWGLGEKAIGDGLLRGEIRINNLHEDRTSPNDVRGNELTQFNQDSAFLSYTHRPGRLLLRLSGEFGNFDFDNTATSSGVVNNDDRDRDFMNLGVRGGLVLSPDYAIYAEIRSTETDYDQSLDRFGFSRSSDGTEIRLGALLDFTGQTAGEFYIGHLDLDFDDPRFGDVSLPSFGGEISWNVSRMTTLTFGASREVGGTTIIGAAGITSTRLAFGANHELLRNLVLSIDFEIGDDEFENVSRNDDVKEFELGGRYLMNRHLQLIFGYRYRDREISPITAGGRVFEIDEFFLRAVGQL